MKHEYKNKIYKTDRTLIAALKTWYNPQLVNKYCESCLASMEHYCYNKIFHFPDILVITFPFTSQIHPPVNHQNTKNKNNNTNINTQFKNQIDNGSVNQNEIFIRWLDFGEISTQKMPTPVYCLWGVLVSFFRSLSIVLLSSGFLQDNVLIFLSNNLN